MNNLQRIIWLASFPKSGNTWLRTFLANYFQPPGSTLDINNLSNFTTGDVRQDLYDRIYGASFHPETPLEWLRVRQRVLRMVAASKPGHHFVKTHCKVMRLEGYDVIPPEYTAAAIYIMRNPFDVAPSYARHMGTDVDAVIEHMKDHLATGRARGGTIEYIGRWDQHIIDWTEMAFGLPLHVIRYEDMLAETKKTYRELFGFLKIKVDKLQLRRAMAATSFKALQRQEKVKGFRERPDTMKQFFTKGKAGAWREDLSPSQVGRIREAFYPTLEKWYPELLEETESFAGAG
ncbi:MAG: sulfotransferase domain-containing protein [Paracoccaceae bacterium]|nr:sulfotransferase domain-containing protein [Paracoccaceae bacterium]